MDELINPSIISDRAAKKDVERIRAHHSKLLQDMAVHQVKVKEFSQNKEMERQALNQEMRQRTSDSKEKSLDRGMNAQKESIRADIDTKKLALEEQKINMPS